jgi:hypothetical protein
MILLTGSLELCFASTEHIFHSPVLGICFVYRLLFWQDCVFGAAISIKRVFFIFLLMNAISGLLKGTVLSVSMLRFQYSLKLSFSSTMAGVYL